jgi:serine/threonine protein kinase
MRTYTIIGTAQYIAPEMVAKTSKNAEAGYDCSFDIWSFGIFLYELVVGDPPFGHA